MIEKPVLSRPRNLWRQLRYVANAMSEYFYKNKKNDHTQKVKTQIQNFNQIIPTHISQEFTWERVIFYNNFQLKQSSYYQHVW